ncbi:MAG: ArnT family glycosyltransferase [Vicinamibacteria bacterium]
MTSSTESVRPSPWLLLVVILAAALGVRLLYLVHVTSQPGFVWDDPDSYMHQGERLASGGEGWRFDFDSVAHAVEGRRYALPPLYPVFLSLFALFPSFPFNAQVAQAVLATLAGALTFFLGREVHSERTGLLAAAFCALWLPNVIAVWSTMQEALYVPLILLGFVMLLRARSFFGFALAGIILGLAALTRSMPLYYLPVAAVLLCWREGFRKGSVFLSGLVLGFALLTVPYSVALSRHLGSPTFIENHGGLRIAAKHGLPRDRPPGLVDTASALLRHFAESPVEAVSAWRTKARSILYVNGGRLLQIYLGAETRLGSFLYKAAAHLFADLALVSVFVLAPFGLALCRRPDRGMFLAAWVLLSFGLTALSGFGGPRSRAPFEPLLMVFAAVTLSGAYRKARPLALAGAGLVSFALAATLVPQLGRSFAANGDYGVHWPLDSIPKRSAMLGSAGFNVLAAGGHVEFSVRPRNGEKPTRLSVALSGAPVEKVQIDAVEHRIRHPWPRVELVYVELEARDAETGELVRVLVVVPKPSEDQAERSR